ncbi:MAG: amidohydrolase [Bacteroidales bacterium]|nr:amidohydrolase [Bacteroidales bacterium]MCF8388617.1 amidohydrolase [Bacteroidales bacterium]MCF8399192.1 amidohydrolase [Bacteroidales bacterium]
MDQILADIILKNASVFTATGKNENYTALAIKEDSIIHLGHEEDTMGLAHDQTVVYDLEGKTVLPGFCDAHAHGVMGGRLINHCLLSTGKTLDDYVAIIKKYNDTHSKNSHIMGFGWAHAPFGSNGPDKKILDKIIPNKPAAFLSIDYHSCWVNSAALKMAGIDSNTSDPDGGKFERYEGTNEPSGCLRESAATNMVLNKLPEPSDEDWKSAIKTYQQKAAEHGITGLFDAGVLNHSQMKAFGAVSELDDSGGVNMRIAQSYVLDPDKGVEQVDAVEKAFQQYGKGKNYQVRVAKIFMDGAIEGHTGFLIEPYADRDGFFGKPVWDQQVFNDTVTELDKRGIQVHVHTIGDGAVQAALNGFEKAKLENGPRDARHTQAHIELADENDIKRFAAMGVYASFQPAWFYMDNNYFEETIPLLSKPRSDRRYMLKNFMDAGVTVAFGSDWPWGNVTSSMNPLDNIGTAVTRENPGDNMLKSYESTQRIDLVTALKNHTIGGAMQNFNDKITGTLEVGKKADIAVLDTDIFKLEPEELFKVKVWMTLFDGGIVYTKDQ